MNSLDYDIDRAAGRIVIRFGGDADGHHLRRELTQLWQAVPDIARFDSICDMRFFTGDVDFDTIRCISTAWRMFCGGPEHGNRRTAVVSFDRFAPVYVRAIALCFIGRELAVFRTLEDAQSWLDGAG